MPSMHMHNNCKVLDPQLQLQLHFYVFYGQTTQATAKDQGTFSECMKIGLFDYTLIVGRLYNVVPGPPNGKVT